MIEKLIGEKEVINKKLTASFGTLNFDEKISEVQTKNKKLFLMVIVFFVLLVALSVVSIVLPNKNVDLSRDEYGEKQKVLPAKVEAKYEKEKVKKDVNIVIKPKELSEFEKNKRMNTTKKNLSKLILGENKNLSNVVYDLDFLEQDVDTGVELSWYTEESSAIDNQGRLNVLDSEKGERVYISARLTLEDKVETVKVLAIIGDVKSSLDFAPSIEKELEQIIENINASTDGKSLELPAKSITGVKLKWLVGERQSYFIFFLGLILLAFFIYSNRYKTIDREISDAQSSVIRDFPDFLNKLLLLLDAGLVVTSAVTKIVLDYKEQKDVYGRRYLYEELSAIEERIEGANASLVVELSEFAQRSGIREVMRFSAIISDNIDKGAMLAEKLKAESEILWNTRKKRAEEAGMLAETKLTFPMVLLLLVLIMITAAPALMDM